MKEGLLLMTVITGFVFLVSFATLYTENVINHGDSCSCPVPIPLVVLSMASLGVFVGTLIFYGFTLFSDKKKKTTGLNLLFSVLSGDEEKLAKLLADNGGILKQSELVRLSGLSRVKVSRLVDKMSKKIVDKETKGKINVIKLKQKFREFL